MWWNEQAIASALKPESGAEADVAEPESGAEADVAGFSCITDIHGLRSEFHSLRLHERRL
jgi:hypothetical protein